MNAPRIRGRVGQATEPPDVAGKWFFEVFVSEMGKGLDEERDRICGLIGPWETEEEAHKELTIATKICVQEYAKLCGATPEDAALVDLKTNTAMPLDKWTGSRKGANE